MRQAEPSPLPRILPGLLSAQSNFSRDSGRDDATYHKGKQAASAAQATTQACLRCSCSSALEPTKSCPSGVKKDCEGQLPLSPFLRSHAVLNSPQLLCELPAWVLLGWPASASLPEKQVQYKQNRFEAPEPAGIRPRLRQLAAGSWEVVAGVVALRDVGHGNTGA